MDSSIDVLHASKFSYPKVGGIEHVIHELAKSCVNRGDTVRVVSATDRGRGHRATYDGVRTVKSSSLGVLLSVPIAPTYPLHLRRAETDADLVHFHLPDPLSVTAQMAIGRSEATTMATFHNDIARGTHRKALAAYRPVLDRFLARLDEIVVTSPRLRDLSPFLKPYRQKCTVISLGIDVDEYGTYEGPTYDLPGESDRPTVLSVGRLIYYKGLEYAIDAMTRVDADLLVAGTGPLGETLREHARQKGLNDCVHFLGYIKEKKLHYCYDAADLFVLPSIATSEGFGIVQLEAMAYGTPVINTNINTGVPWVSQDGKTGLTVPPRDAEALSDAIATLLADNNRRERLGRAARTRANERFTHERMIEEYLQRYDALVSR